MITQKMALRVMPGAYGFRVLSSDTIIQLHVDKAKEVGKVYYSTDININAKHIPYLKELLLYNENVAYAANICCVLTNKKDKVKIVPDDAAEFSPDIFASEEKLIWFLLSDFRKVSDTELKILRTNDGDDVYTKISKLGRANRFYYL